MDLQRDERLLRDELAKCTELTENQNIDAAMKLECRRRIREIENILGVLEGQGGKG